MRLIKVAIITLALLLVTGSVYLLGPTWGVVLTLPVSVPVAGLVAVECWRLGWNWNGRG